MNIFNKLIYFAIVLAMVVVVLGAYTRLADAGLGCPDWPGCYGQLIVPDLAPGSIIDGYERPLEPDKGWKEMVHRYAASTLGLVVFLILLLSVTGKPKRDQSLWLPTFLAFFVVLQGLFGMWTVTLKVHPGIVTAHLIGAFATTSMLFWLALNQRVVVKPSTPIPIGSKYLLVFGFVALVLQIILGGWTSTNYAATSCGEFFPTCLGQWWPPMNFTEAMTWGALGEDYEFAKNLDNKAKIAIQMTHRIGAAVVTVTLASIIYTFGRHSHLKPTLLWMGVFMVLQVSLGIMNVVLSIPMAIAVMHNAIALMLLLSMVALIHTIFKPRI
jgi:cytochrome c oxidase assembly protein subunit 15